MFQVVKRDGEIAEFKLDKIAEAVKKAFDATENPVQKTERKNPQYEVHHSGLQRDCKQLCEGGGLESQGELHSDLLRGGTDSEQFRCRNGQLLAV